MNGIGFSELLLIALVMAFAIKPKHYPELLRTFTQLFQHLQKLLFTTRKVIDREIKQLTLKQNEARAEQAEHMKNTSKLSND